MKIERPSVRSFAIALTAAMAVLLGGALALAPSVGAQGCVMCKLSAQAAGEEAAKALDYGIFILMVPTVIIFMGVFYWAFTHRDRSLADQEEEEKNAEAVRLNPSTTRPL